MRRTTETVCGSLLSAAMAVALNASAAPLDLEKDELRLGFIKLTDMAPLAVAYELGYFEDEGLFRKKSDEHRAILDACRDRDQDRARDLLVDHLADTAIRLMAAQRHAPYALVEAVALAKGGAAAARS